jgi:uncharacterized protein (DUF302 family)
MSTTSDYGIRKTLSIGFDDAVARTRELLQAEGFGVLTEIDMQAKLKEKIGAEIQKYLILGACNPPLAHKAVQAEPEIGLLLPCNVIVYEAKDGRTVVSAMDPDVMMKVVPDNPVLQEVAKDARARLERAIAKL